MDTVQRVLDENRKRWVGHEAHRETKDASKILVEKHQGNLHWRLLLTWILENVGPCHCGMAHHWIVDGGYNLQI
jgi:hypothetical protein